MVFSDKATPLPIPNRVVKLVSGDDNAFARMCENTSLPGSFFWEMISTDQNTAPEISHKLLEVANEESLSEQEVMELWNQVPVGDMGEMSYLEASAQCILEVSSLIDNKNPNLSQNQSIAKKYRLMSKLLKVKSEQLEALQ